MVYGTSNKHTCAQKVPLVKKMGNYMPRKGPKLEIGIEFHRGMLPGGLCGQKSKYTHLLTG